MQQGDTSHSHATTWSQILWWIVLKGRGTGKGSISDWVCLLSIQELAIYVGTAVEGIGGISTTTLLYRNVDHSIFGFGVEFVEPVYAHVRHDRI